MKYITTDKHPELKEGIKFKECTGVDNYVKYSSKRRFYFLSHNQLQAEISKGYIKEVEEKEFTKSDMIEFSIHVVSPVSLAVRKDVFTEWQKHRQ